MWTQVHKYVHCVVNITRVLHYTTTNKHVNRHARTDARTHIPCSASCISFLPYFALVNLLIQKSLNPLAVFCRGTHLSHCMQWVPQSKQSCSFECCCCHHYVAEQYVNTATHLLLKFVFGRLLVVCRIGIVTVAVVHAVRSGGRNRGIQTGSRQSFDQARCILNRAENREGGEERGLKTYAPKGLR